MGIRSATAIKVEQLEFVARGHRPTYMCGDRIRYAGEPGELELVADPNVADEATAWHLEEWGPGCGITTEKWGAMFLRCTEENEDLELVCSVAARMIRGSRLVIVMSLLASMSPETTALADSVSSAGAGQFTQNCQTSNPRLERLASAIERGDFNYLRSALDQGLEVNETWRCPRADMPVSAPEDRLAWPGRYLHSAVEEGRRSRHRS